MPNSGSNSHPGRPESQSGGTLPPDASGLRRRKADRDAATLRVLTISHARHMAESASLEAVVGVYINRNLSIQVRNAIQANNLTIEQSARTATVTSSVGKVTLIPDAPYSPRTMLISYAGYPDAELSDYETQSSMNSHTLLESLSHTIGSAILTHPGDQVQTLLSAWRTIEDTAYAQVGFRPDYSVTGPLTQYGKIYNVRNRDGSLVSSIDLSSLYTNGYMVIRASVNGVPISFALSTDGQIIPEPKSQQPVPNDNFLIRRLIYTSFQAVEDFNRANAHPYNASPISTAQRIMFDFLTHLSYLGRPF